MEMGHQLVKRLLWKVGRVLKKKKKKKGAYLIKRMNKCVKRIY